MSAPAGPGTGGTPAPEGRRGAASASDAPQGPGATPEAGQGRTEEGRGEGRDPRDPAGPADPAAGDPLLEAVRRRHARREAARREGEPSVGRRLAQIGVLGWLVVAPMLAGLFLGRWLDARLGSGLFWTLPLLLLGLALGAWTGWRWMKSQ